MKATPQKAKTAEDEKAAFQVRGGFVLHIGIKSYRAGEIVDLTEKQAHAHKHMIELAPEQEENKGRSKK